MSRLTRIGVVSSTDLDEIQELPAGDGLYVFQRARLFLRSGILSAKLDTEDESFGGEFPDISDNAMQDSQCILDGFVRILVCPEVGLWLLIGCDTGEINLPWLTETAIVSLFSKLSTSLHMNGGYNSHP